MNKHRFWAFSLFLLLASLAQAQNALNIILNDVDGPANGRVFVYAINDQDGSESLTASPFISGTRSIALDPGTTPPQSDGIGGFSLADDEEIDLTFFFEKGTLDVLFSDHDGPANARVFVHQIDPQTGTQTTVTNRSINPTESIALKPGSYLVQVRYDGITPSQTRDLPGILITDTAHITRNLIFGSDRLTGDFDGDGRVDYVDLFLFADGYASNDLRFDLDGSSSVDEADYLIFTANFDRTIQP